MLCLFSALNALQKRCNPSRKSSPPPTMRSVHIVRKGAGKGLALLPTEGGPFLHKARWRSKNHNACQPLERSLRLQGLDHRKRLFWTLTASKAKKSRSSPRNWANKGRLFLGRGGPQGEIPFLKRLQRRPSLHTLQGACRHGDLSK